MISINGVIEEDVCPICNGKGRILPKKISGVMVEVDEECKACYGTGTVNVVKSDDVTYVVIRRENFKELMNPYKSLFEKIRDGDAGWQEELKEACLKYGSSPGDFDGDRLINFIKHTKE